MSSLKALFQPKSVALIGASSDPKKYGYWTAKGLIDGGFNGDLYFISRTSASDILGITPYASIEDVPGPVDLGIVAISPKHIVPVVQSCADKGVKALVIVATGFGETGAQGKALEQEISAIAKKSGMRIQGPNCMGIFSSAVHLNASTIDLDDGHIGLVIQSGNFGIDINFNAKTRGIGYSCWASIGNQMDLRFADFLEYMGSDENTRAVLMYMEGLRVASADDGRNFLNNARQVSLEKPIVAIKIGRSQAGARAAASHTGSLAGSEKVFDAALCQGGVIRVDTPGELLDVGEAFTRCKPPQGKRIAILTDGGGHGVMATDMAEQLGLDAFVLSEKTQAKLREVLMPHCPIKNPVDLAGTPEHDMWVFDRCAEILLDDPEVDAMVITGLYGGYCDFSEEFRQMELDVAKSLVERSKKSSKPILMHSMYAAQQPESLTYIRKHGFPVYASIDSTMKAMGALVKFSGLQKNIREELNAPAPALPDDRLLKVNNLFSNVRSQNRTNLVETEAREVLKAYGFNLPPHYLAQNEAEAAAFFETLGEKAVVMKIVSPDILHKTDANGVMLNISSPQQAQEAYKQLIANAQAYDPQADIFGVMLTPMAAGDVECIIGSSYDPTFGPVVMFGLGGIFVEVLKDVAFRVAPVKYPEAGRMVSEIRGYPLLAGVRGKAGVDIASIIESISKVSYMVAELADIAEVDLNPVFASTNGITVVDARIILHEQKAGTN